MFAPARPRARSTTELATAIRPTAPASTRRLLVAEPLRPLLPDGALRRGSAVVVAGTPGMGATTLGLALLATASTTGHWGAVVGLDDPGVVAMAELGVDLRRVVFVPRPRGAWAVAVAELLDGVDVVVVRPPGRVAHTAARRLLARVRDRAVVLAVLVEHRDDWPVPADVALEVTDAAWHTTGRLVGRRSEVRATGRRVTGPPRRAALWLPDAHGAVTEAG
jgi:hypothetical protein